MSNKRAFLFPGQGAQYPSMGKDFYDTFSVAKETFEEADDFLSFKISTLMFEGPEAELTLTRNSQLAIYVNSIAILRTLSQQLPEFQPAICAGLSLGEYTALCASGRISFTEGLSLVKKRALFMNEACEKTSGTMAVVLGLASDIIAEVITGLKLNHKVWVANCNCPGQVVISGTEEGIDTVSEHLKEKGAKRILALQVHGAFHSGLMSSAQEKLAPEIEKTPFKTSDIGLVMNVPGDFVNDLQDVRENLTRQVTSSVLWEKGVRCMINEGVDLFVEIGCGKTLTGMMKKTDRSASVISIDKVQDLDHLLKSNQVSVS